MESTAAAATPAGGAQTQTCTAEESFEVETVEVDPTRRGYTKVPNYFAYYWTPLLGAKGALTYERLCSFAHGTKEECYPSVALLADITGVDRHDLTGRVRRDRRPGRRGEYYQPGYFQRLAEQGLVQVSTEERRGTRHYRFKVLKFPPLLTPEQLARLSPRLQRKHQELLERCQREREAFAQPALPLAAKSSEAAPGGGVTPPPRGCDAATRYLNSTNRTKKLIPLSPPSCLPHAPLPQEKKSEETQEQKTVQDFYSKLGQPRISRQKVDGGVKILSGLKAQGFTLTEMICGMTWLLTHQDRFGGEIHSLGLLPHVIGQALQEHTQSKKAAAKCQEQAQEAQRRREEQDRQRALSALYQTLPPTEQAALQAQAAQNLLQSGVPRRFLSAVLLKDEACRLLGEQGARQGQTALGVPAAAAAGP